MRARYPCSTLLDSIAQSYTPAMFDVFFKEYEASQKFLIKESDAPALLGSKTFEVWNTKKTKTLNRTHTVTLCPASTSITCTCCKFQNFRILCRHALRPMDILGSYLLLKYNYRTKKICIVPMVCMQYYNALQGFSWESLPRLHSKIDVHRCALP